MAAYAVMARIERADPHLTLHDVDRDIDGDGVATTSLPDDTIDEVGVLEMDHASDPGPFAERLTRARELWRQTTFYLFDADSWRA